MGLRVLGVHSGGPGLPGELSSPANWAVAATGESGGRRRNENFSGLFRGERGEGTERWW
jgi:hypothetical protein